MAFLVSVSDLGLEQSRNGSIHKCGLYSKANGMTLDWAIWIDPTSWQQYYRLSSYDNIVVLWSEIQLETEFVYVFL